MNLLELRDALIEQKLDENGVKMSDAKKFPLRVRWDFKISVEGYGRNVKEALASAAERLAYQVESEFDLTDFLKIQEHEVERIDEGDIETYGETDDE